MNFVKNIFTLLKTNTSKESNDVNTIPEAMNNHKTNENEDFPKNEYSIETEIQVEIVSIDDDLHEDYVFPSVVGEVNNAETQFVNACKDLEVIENTVNEVEKIESRPSYAKTECTSQNYLTSQNDVEEIAIDKTLTHNLKNYRNEYPLNKCDETGDKNKETTNNKTVLATDVTERAEVVDIALSMYDALLCSVYSDETSSEHTNNSHLEINNNNKIISNVPNFIESVMKRQTTDDNCYESSHMTERTSVPNNIESTDCAGDANTEGSLILDLDTNAWMNAKEFDNVVEELYSGDLPDITESLDKYINNKDNVKISEVTHNEDISKKTNCNEDVLIDERLKTNLITEFDQNDVICISSDEEDCNVSIYGCCQGNRTFINSFKQYIKMHKKYRRRIKNCNTTTKDINNNKLELNKDKNKQNTKNNNNFKITTVNDSKKQSIEIKVEENEHTDVISISSGDIEDPLNDSYGSGYHSSDFEFITEEEAGKDGLLINYKKKGNASGLDTCKTIEVTPDSGFSGSQSSRSSEEVLANDIPGPSRPVERRYEPTNSRFDDYSYRDHHSIPQGEQYLSLFQGIYAPNVPYMFENKSMPSSNNLEYDGVGFDMRVLSRQIVDCDVDDDAKEEAKENAKMILSMYPYENKRRRHRF